jgi:hypothetical protein
VGRTIAGITETKSTIAWTGSRSAWRGFSKAAGRSGSSPGGGVRRTSKPCVERLSEDIIRSAARRGTQAFLVEALITFILVFVVISVATDERAPAAIAPIAVGFALAVGVFIAGPVTGGVVNPARA